MQPYFYLDNSDSLRSTAVLRVFKAIQSYTERKKDMMSPEIELRISRTEGRAFYQLLITATYLFFYIAVPRCGTLYGKILFILPQCTFLNWWLNMSKRTI